MATQAAPTTEKKKVKRGVGPVVITYIGADNKEVKRVPEDGSQIKVASKDGKSVVLSFDSLPVKVQKMLGVRMLAKEMDVAVRNGMKEDGANVLTIANDKFAAFKEGKFYSRGEGKGGPGRSFDFDKWVMIAKLRQDILVKNKVVSTKTNKPAVPATEKQLEMYRTSLESMLPADRKVHVAKLRASPVGKLAESQYDAMQAKAEMDDSDEEDMDLF